jgi:hypothetical protein
LIASLSVEAVVAAIAVAVGAGCGGCQMVVESSRLASNWGQIAEGDHDDGRTLGDGVVSLAGGGEGTATVAGCGGAFAG